MRLSAIIFCICVSIAGLSQNKPAPKKPVNDITIQWADSLKGTYQFTSDWDFAEGIYIDAQGKLHCDGICPPEIERMKDKNGAIIKDSLRAYYKLIDTTHYFHTIDCQSSCYEYNGTDFMTCIKNEAGFINCYTMNNVATHSSLRLSIFGDKCIPSINLTSPVAGQSRIFKCTSGFIIIDKTMLSKGFLKAEFDFNFSDPKNTAKTIYWKGKIQTPITEL